MANMRIVVAVLLLVSGLGYLLYSASRAEGVVYKNATEIRAEAASGRTFRITGNVKEGTLDRNLADRHARFILIDHLGNEMAISYVGSVPDTLRDRGEVVVAGRYDAAEDRLEATELVAKCPSKYQGQYDSATVEAPAR